MAIFNDSVFDFHLFHSCKPYSLRQVYPLPTLPSANGLCFSCKHCRMPMLTEQSITIPGNNTPFVSAFGQSSNAINILLIKHIPTVAIVFTATQPSINAQNVDSSSTTFVKILFLFHFAPSFLVNK